MIKLRKLQWLPFFLLPALREGLSLDSSVVTWSYSSCRRFKCSNYCAGNGFLAPQQRRRCLLYPCPLANSKNDDDISSASATAATESDSPIKDEKTGVTTTIGNLEASSAMGCPKDPEAITSSSPTTTPSSILSPNSNCQRPANNDGSQVPGGPFIRSYPRYRVDLTRIKRRQQSNGPTSTQQNSNNNSFLESSTTALWKNFPFGGSSTTTTATISLKEAAAVKKTMRQLYAKRFPTVRDIQVVVNVLEDDDKPSKTTSPNNNNKKDNHYESWFPTCHAMLELWQAATDVQTTGQNRLVVLADPTLSGVARNFVDLIEWAEDEALKDEPTKDQSASLRQRQRQQQPPSSFPVHAEFIASPKPNANHHHDSRNKRKQETSNSPCAVYLTPSPLNRNSGKEKVTAASNAIASALSDDTAVVGQGANDEERIVKERTRAWVQRLLVELGVCPFTKHADWSGQGLKKEGVPIGRIAYHAFVVSDQDKNVVDHRPAPSSLFRLLCPLMACTWKAMVDMLLAGPNGKEGGVSSILLAAPAFDDHVEFWCGPLFAVLEASVVAAQAEPWLGVVCFHPNYAVSDGSSWPGFGHMHSVPRLQQWMMQQQQAEVQQQSPPEESREVTGDNSTSSRKNDYSLEDIAAGGAWQRRTPHATINVLRANQLAAAEQVRSSDTLYPRNIRVLRDQIGFAQLWQDLQREQSMLSARGETK
ncbi:hypothetical protein ACA910_000302 [Epithemia clementina (nom. ined.)]